MTSVLNLKPCPFCGGKAKLEGRWIAHCADGACIGHHFDPDGMGEWVHEENSAADAIRKWNARVP